MIKSKYHMVFIIAVFSMIVFSCNDSDSSSSKKAKKSCSDEGCWYYYDDNNETGGNSQLLVDGVPPEKDETGAWVFHYKTIEIDGKKEKVSILGGTINNGFKYPYIGMGIKFSKDDLTCCSEFGESVKKAQGVKFKCKGNGLQYRLRIETSDVKDYNWHGYVFKTVDSAQEISILFDTDLTQENWGTSVSFNKNNIICISFQTIESSYAKPFNVDLQVWNVEPITSAK